MFPRRSRRSSQIHNNINIMKKILLIILLTGFCLLCFRCNESKNNIFKADVIVYGGTSAAVTTAIQVHRMGLSVIVVSPDKHLGGMSSSGLGFTDTGNKKVIGGLAREFYQLLYQHYQEPGSWKWQKAIRIRKCGSG